ncbi:MAG: hypothetical protein QNK37_35615, partial [Acidobacteriota bacterium]|nr:hypothetical protein [Acidobacteriota bacterium]
MIFARLFIFSIFLTGSIFAQRPLTVEDIMKFNHIKDVTISADGEWVGYATTKDRGDGKGVIRATKGAGHYRIPLGRRPVISNKGAWAAMEIVPSLAETEKAKKKKKKLKNAMVLINTLSGKSEQWERVKSFAFSDDELWFARLFHEEEKEEEDKDKKADKKKKKEKEELGTRLVLRRLQTGDEYQIDGVTRYAFDKQGKYLVYAVALPGGEGNGLFMRYLTG